MDTPVAKSAFLSREQLTWHGFGIEPTCGWATHSPTCAGTKVGHQLKSETTSPTPKLESSPSSKQIHALADVLHAVVARCDIASRLATDPVGVVRRFSSPADRELAGLLASSLAFGNVKALRASIERVVARLGPHIGEVLDDPEATNARLQGTGHRMVRDVDIARLLLGARAMQHRYGRLGARFASQLDSCGGDLHGALCAWTRELRSAASFPSDPHRRGPSHILPDPAGLSACKRLMLYLRWMVRPDDGVDLGLWTEVSPSLLVIPLDTHIHRLARAVGLTNRSSPSWAAAQQVTNALRKIDPNDPVQFDFALCHMGMEQGCTFCRDEIRCAGCGVRTLCGFWHKQ